MFISHRQLSAAVLFLQAVFLSVPGHSQEFPQKGDTYMISRGSYGEFVGSHKIYRQNSEGLHKVSYCGTDYWVLPYTVAWTQIEVERNRSVKVEYNFGKGWRPVCNNPESEVSLNDLGIAKDAREVVAAYRRLADDNAGPGRFSTISKAFQNGFKDSGHSTGDSSYHSQ